MSKQNGSTTLNLFGNESNNNRGQRQVAQKPSVNQGSTTLNLFAEHEIRPNNSVDLEHATEELRKTVNRDLPVKLHVPKPRSTTLNLFNAPETPDNSQNVQIHSVAEEDEEIHNYTL